MPTLIELTQNRGKIKTKMRETRCTECGELFRQPAPSWAFVATCPTCTPALPKSPLENRPAIDSQMRKPPDLVAVDNVVHVDFRRGRA